MHGMSSCMQVQHGSLVFVGTNDDAGAGKAFEERHTSSLIST